MTLEELRTYTNTIADKHRSGKTTTEAEFNNFIDVVNLEMFNAEYMKLVQTASDQNIPLHRLLFSSSSLKEFKVYGHSVALTSGIGSLPSDYRHYLALKGQMIIPGDIVSYKTRDVDIVSDGEFNSMINNVLFNDPAENPKGVTYGDSVKVVPTSMASLILNYVKVPDTPYYDYCVKSSTNQVIYMPIGSLISGGDLYQPGDIITILETGVVHLSGSTTYTSQSVELEWEDIWHPEFADRVLLKMGISVKDLEMYKMVQNEQAT